MEDGTKAKGSRRRRSSSLLYQEPPESMEHMSDQSALPNLNANWVNAKGEWTPLDSGRKVHPRPWKGVGLCGLDYILSRRMLIR